MTDAPKTSNRRRRWLIMAFVLVLVSLHCWWNWPMGDSRLVGRWQEEGGGKFSDVVIFKENGLFELDSFNGSRRIIRMYRTEGDSLLMGNDTTAFLLDYLEPAIEWWGQRTGRYFVPFQKEMMSTFAFEGANTLLLRAKGHKEAIRYTRIPE